MKNLKKNEQKKWKLSSLTDSAGNPASSKTQKSAENGEHSAQLEETGSTPTRPPFIGFVSEGGAKEDRRWFQEVGEPPSEM